MFIYDCIVKMGHFGAGRSLERRVRVRANDPVEAMRRAKSLPGVKKGALWGNGASVLQVALVR